jgi:hypothetical protein
LTRFRGTIRPSARGKKFYRKLDRLRADWYRDKVWVTIVGRIDTRDSLNAMVMERPYGRSRAGFGHLGQAPAEIHPFSLQDVTVERGRPSAGKKAKK